MKFQIYGTKEKRPAIEFRVCPKEGLGGMGQNPIIKCQVDFPAGKIVSYSKFKECHLDQIKVPLLLDVSCYRLYSRT